MKRNPLWDAQAQQFLKSGVLQNALARQAMPGAGMRQPPPAIPISMIDRPVEPQPQPQPQMRPQQPVRPQRALPGSPAPRMGEYDQVQAPGQQGPRRPAPASTANQGTPFQYRVSRGMR